jgi:pimeloyl-ACP methyl ester carboxylesterase
MTTVHHRYANVNGQRLFYRQAGPPGAPAVVLLHGFPASSFMFRDLIPLLADRYHVIAPDHLGFGLSDAPPADEFGYTFDALAGLTADLLDQLGAGRYAMYVHDYGAPVAGGSPWRTRRRSPRSSPRAATGMRPGSRRSSGSRYGSTGAIRTRGPRRVCGRR